MWPNNQLAAGHSLFTFPERKIMENSKVLYIYNLIRVQTDPILQEYRPVQERTLKQIAYLLLATLAIKSSTTLGSASVLKSPS